MNKFFLLLFLSVGSCLFVSGKDIIPSKPATLVNDYADILSDSEKDLLEEKLTAYSDSTSNQIAIVILQTLEGNDPAKTAYTIGDQWGVGGPNQDNGMVILVSMEEHEIFFATGKGMEGPVPDVMANRIIDQIMIPDFKKELYYQAFNRATDIIIELAAGEFVDELQEKKNDWILTLIIIGIVILFLFFGSRFRGGGGGYIDHGGWHIPRYGGGFGGFGGGSFGGGGGGFGGFGGGSFGGGGAGGRW